MELEIIYNLIFCKRNAKSFNKESIRVSQSLEKLPALYETRYCSSKIVIIYSTAMW